MGVGIVLQVAQEHGLSDSAQAGEDDAATRQVVARASDDGVEVPELRVPADESRWPQAGTGCVRIEDRVHALNYWSLLHKTQ